MAGKRKSADGEKLPVRVYKTKYAYVWKPRDNQTITLCKANAAISEVWRAWEDAAELSNNRQTVQWIVEQFLSSADFRELAASTRKDYYKHSKFILSVFGKMDPDRVEPQHIRLYMDKRGLRSRVQANREKAFFSRVYRFAYERGLVKRNPCKGVRQFKETPRNKYITDAEYQAVYACAPLAVKAAMEIAYVCCARQSDVLMIRRSDVLDEGLFIKQGKTGKEQVKSWSPRLRAAISLARSLPLKQGIASQYIIHKHDGSRYTRNGFNSAWAKARSEARAQTGMPLDFTFHDIKAKGVSDLDGALHEKQRISGHKTATQTARYDRKADIVPAVDGFNKREKQG